VVERLSAETIDSAGHLAAIRKAFNLPDAKATTAALKDLSARQEKILADAQHLQLSPEQQSKLLYEKLKDDPVAHIASAVSPAGHIYYPTAAKHYKVLAQALSVPGRLAQAADAVSPYLRIGGGLAAGVGAGLGGYMLLNYLRKRLAPARKRLAAPAS
jgi:hypothetical protein